MNLPESKNESVDDPVYDISRASCASSFCNSSNRSPPTWRFRGYLSKERRTPVVLLLRSALSQLLREHKARRLHRGTSARRQRGRGHHADREVL